ncbi:MAG: DUF4238 domain-containing protein [Methanosarcinaceae archaeon]|nr:DUF4238 domain-containing protein [Methanosarcinaceae archaeon]
MPDYRKNHYVPKWYQYLFLPDDIREKKFFYLDLTPDTIINGKTRYKRKALLRRGPPTCFYEQDLYITKFGERESTEIEEKFFGKVDNFARASVEYWSNFKHPSYDEESFRNLLLYMSTQKLRTPKGLKDFANLVKLSDKNAVLIKLQELQQLFCALWTECIWSIVDASQSETKFIISDHPVTVYNQGCFPRSKWCIGANDPGIWLNGTQTIFPLSINRALLLTNLSWVRNPYGNPLKERPHPNLLRPAMFNFTDIQTGRILSEEEVVVLNYIIKERAYRYIAAANEEWLYPEEKFHFKHWGEIGSSHVLMPDPRSVTFSSEIFVGYDSGKSEAFDEYGRRPWHRDYNDKMRQDYEWNTFHAFQGEYARLFGPKRRGVTFEFGDKDKSEDSADFHAYHLGLEQKLKPLIKKKIKRRRK